FCKLSNRCIERDRSIKYPRAVHVDGQIYSMSLLANVGAMFGRHNAAASEIVRVFEADESRRSRIIRLVDVQRGSDLVPRQHSRTVLTFHRADQHSGNDR